MKKIIIISAVLILGALALTKDAIVGFTTNRGFTTIQETNFLSNTGGTLTGGLTGTTLVMTGSASFGGTASVSTTDFEFLSPGTTSLNFDSGTGKGTCLEVRAMDGSIAYARFSASDIIVNTTSCK